MSHSPAFKGLYDKQAMDNSELVLFGNVCLEIESKFLAGKKNLGESVDKLKGYRSERVFRNILKEGPEAIETVFVKTGPNRMTLHMNLSNATSVLLSGEGTEMEKARRFYEFYNLGLVRYATDICLGFVPLADDGYALLISELASLCKHELQPHADLNRYMMEEEIYGVSMYQYISNLFHRGYGESVSDKDNTYDELAKLFGESLFPFSLFRGNMFKDDGSNKENAEENIGNFLINHVMEYPVTQQSIRQDMRDLESGMISGMFHPSGMLEYIRKLNPTGTMWKRSKVNRYSPIRFLILFGLEFHESYFDYLIDTMLFHTDEKELVKLLRERYVLEPNEFHRQGFYLAKHYSFPEDLRKMIWDNVRDHSPSADRDLRILKQRFQNKHALKLAL